MYAIIGTAGFLLLIGRGEALVIRWSGWRRIAVEVVFVSLTAFCLALIFCQSGRMPLPASDRGLLLDDAKDLLQTAISPTGILAVIDWAALIKIWILTMCMAAIMSTIRIARWKPRHEGIAVFILSLAIVSVVYSNTSLYHPVGVILVAAGIWLLSMAVLKQELFKA